MVLVKSAYVFYADAYMIQNFLMKFVILYLSLYCHKLHSFLVTKKGIGKILLASFLGTLVEVTGLLVGDSYHLFLILIHLLEMPLMMRLILGKEGKNWRSVVITGYFFVVIVNGMIEVLWNWFGMFAPYFLLIVVSGGSVVVGFRIFRKNQQVKKKLMDMELMHSGIKMITKGYYDSGNRLKDPYTGKGVHIASLELVKKLPVDLAKKLYIPYQALGNKDALIEICYIEYIKIYTPTKILEQQMVPIGIAEEELFQGKTYQMILNEEIE